MEFIYIFFFVNVLTCSSSRMNYDGVSYILMNGFLGFGVCFLILVIKECECR